MRNSNNDAAYCNVHEINTNGTQILTKTLQNYKALEYISSNINLHESKPYNYIVRDYNNNSNRYRCGKVVRTRRVDYNLLNVLIH